MCNNGRFSGRIYIDGVTAFASLIFLINTAIGLKTLRDTPEGLINQMITLLYNLDINLIERIKTSLIFIKEWIPTLVLGSLSMAVFGEHVLTKLPKPNIRSLPSVLEKFPSDFSVITGNNEIETKMKEMTSHKDIISVKCITNTFRAFDVIHSNLETQWRVLSKKGIKKEIRNRILKLKEMSDEGKIQYIENTFGRFRMLLINDEEIMFTVPGGNNEKIGLYTKEKYIIQFCKNLFENAWENHKNRMQ